MIFYLALHINKINIVLWLSTSKEYFFKKCFIYFDHKTSSYWRCFKLNLFLEQFGETPLIWNIPVRYNGFVCHHMLVNKHKTCMSWKQPKCSEDDCLFDKLFLWHYFHVYFAMTSLALGSQSEFLQKSKFLLELNAISLIIIMYSLNLKCINF